MEQVRYPAVSGSFYPENPYELKTSVRGFIQSPQIKAQTEPPLALVVPHAGYMYSGPVAGPAYAALASRAEEIESILLIGPSHRVGFTGLALSSATHFKTPLGLVSVDVAAGERALSLPFAQVLDDAHLDEHCLEVQLPFLQCILNRFMLIPVLAGSARPEQVAQLIELFPPSPRSAVIISTDLSHYHSYQDAQRLDALTATHIQDLDYRALRGTQACGAVPLRGLLYYAQQHGLRPQLLQLANSGDTAGDRSRVVGYASFMFN